MSRYTQLRDFIFGAYVTQEHSDVITDWSPNNLKTIVVTPSYMAIEHHILNSQTQKGHVKRKVMCKSFIADNDTKLKAVFDCLEKPCRLLSAIEELIYVETNPEQYKIDMFKLTKLVQVDKARFPRLRYITVLKKEIPLEAMKNILEKGNSKHIHFSDVIPQHWILKKNTINVDWWRYGVENHEPLRPNFYALDSYVVKDKADTLSGCLDKCFTEVAKEYYATEQARADILKGEILLQNALKSKQEKNRGFWNVLFAAYPWWSVLFYNNAMWKGFNTKVPYDRMSIAALTKDIYIFNKYTSEEGTKQPYTAWVAAAKVQNTKGNNYKQYLKEYKADLNLLKLAMTNKKFMEYASEEQQNMLKFLCFGLFNLIATDSDDTTVGISNDRFYKPQASADLDTDKWDAYINARVSNIATEENINMDLIKSVDALYNVLNCVIDSLLCYTFGFFAKVLISNPADRILIWRLTGQTFTTKGYDPDNEDRIHFTITRKLLSYMRNLPNIKGTEEHFLDNLKKYAVEFVELKNEEEFTLKEKYKVLAYLLKGITLYMDFVTRDRFISEDGETPYLMRSAWKFSNWVSEEY